jgi:hypothetical protein
MGKRQRILTLDLLRGGFMMAIIVDHLGWGPSLFHLLSGGGKLFVSPAEGFFVISGILVGYIYGPRMVQSFKKTTAKLWKRAFLLYSLSVVFTLFYTAIAIHSAHAAGLPPLWSKGADSFFLNTLLARYSYGWTDFLPRYAVFMAVAPFLLWLITRGKAWLVAMSSIAVWAILHKTALFLPFSSWEVIFIPGMIIGYYLPQIEAWAKAIPSQVQTISKAGLYTVAVGTFVTSVVVQVVLPMVNVTTPGITTALASVGTFFDKETVGLGRLLLGVAWFWALYILVRRHEQAINRRTAGILETFGAKSLYTYGIHGFVVFMFTLLSPAPARVTVLDSTLISVMILTLIYILVISPVVSRYLSYQYYHYRLHSLLRYNRPYETA